MMEMETASHGAGITGMTDATDTADTTSHTRDRAAPQALAEQSARASVAHARELHDKGYFDDAALQYEAVLAGQPDHVDALHFYGVLQFQRGRSIESEALLRKAASVRPHPMLLADLGAVLAAAGRVEEALAQFDAALMMDPRHLHTLVRRGNTLLELHQYERALAAYDKALAISPLLLDALCNRGGALRALGRHSEALETYTRALTVDPRSFESLYNRGHVLRDLRRYTEALQSYDGAIALMPGNAAMLSMRGRTLIDLGRASEALTSFNEAIAIQPDFVEALYNSAVALERLGRAAEAVQRCDRVLAMAPTHVMALACRGNALLQLERYQDAWSSYTQALEIEPGSSDLLCNRGTALRYLGRYEEAVESYDAALAVSPNLAEAWGNRGNALQDLHRYEEAKISLEHAIAIQPYHAMHWFNRGNVLYEMGHPGAAFQAYDKAIELDPNYVDAHFARASLHLMQGNFAQGWPEYEWRLLDLKTAKRERVFQQPRWRGDAALEGQTILLYAEQGFGDTLQFCRYVELVQARDARVILEVPPALKSLLSASLGSAQVVSRGDPLPQFDWHCPLLSLPAAFRTELHTIPGRTPYLSPDATATEQWRQRLGPPQRPRVGLAWSGNSEHRNDRNRSMALATLLPLLGAEIEWISLQKVVRERDLPALSASPLLSFDADIRDFSDTAALMQSLDLVISVDTAVAHLAGALHRPVWIVLPNPPEWRWMREGTDSPWYPSARLFRQTQAGRWDDVIEALRAALYDALV